MGEAFTLKELLEANNKNFSENPAILKLYAIFMGVVLNNPVECYNIERQFYEAKKKDSFKDINTVNSLTLVRGFEKRKKII